MTVIVVIFFCAALGAAFARALPLVIQFAAGFAPLALAFVLFAIPADEARAHEDNSATLHAETYPLHEAAKAGDLDSANHFITVHMADVNEKDANDPDFILWIPHGYTPLHYAARHGQVSVASVLIAAGADVNAKSDNGSTPLHQAASRSASAASILIAAGADVNAKNNNGFTPLHWALSNDHESASAVSILIAAGADVNAKSDNGSTPLHQAAIRDRASPISILTAAGADVNAKNNNGSTPLHQAAFHGRASAVSVLITAGADVNAKNNDGNTPLYVRHASNVNVSNSSVVPILIAAGGHWGDPCANAAVVNPAGPSSPCLCESPNMGTPEDCTAPSVESCGGLSPPKHYDATAGECVPFKFCVFGAILNRDTNLCECAGAAVLDNTGTSCLCESPNVGTRGDCAAPSAESCGGLIPPKHYDSTAGECVRLATCRYEEVRNEETNTCECHAPNMRYYGYYCSAPSANNCLRTSPPSFYSPTLSACAPYDECVAAGDCALSAYVCGRGFSPSMFYDSGAENCVPFVECNDTARLNRSTNQCECTRSSSQRYLRPSGVCESQCNSAETAVQKGNHYECECAATKNGRETTNVSGVCEFLYPCHDSAIRKADNSGCECPSGTYAHGDPSGGSHSHIPDTAICHADHAPVFHDLNGWLDFIQTDNSTLILHFISDHNESPNQLAHAIQHSAHRAITILINRGANLNLADSDGDTPLHLAARRADTPENAALVSFLLDKGANPNIFNNSRWRPLDLADGRDGYPRRRKIMSALIAGGANWSDECVGGKVPNEFTPPKCKCPARLSIDNNGLCECPAHSHSQVNGLCLPKDSAQVDAEIAKMQVELARLRAALVSLNARISLSAEMPRETVEDIAEQARETAAEIDWRRANFVALGRRAEAGEAPPPVALSDTAAECRMRGGEVRIDSGSGTRICLGLDQSGTFCLVDSGDAFPCRGLFKHVRRCNDVYHRPALNAFICGARCGVDETARGKGCE